MGFVADGYRPGYICLGERLQRVENIFPAALPQFQQIRTRLGRFLKFGIAVAVRFLSVGDRKSTRLNSSHANISYAVFCLKKKTTMTTSGWLQQTIVSGFRASAIWCSADVVTE